MILFSMKYMRKNNKLFYFWHMSVYIYLAALNFFFYLQDLDDSWDLLEKDVGKLGDGFQDFADKFYVILVSL